MPKTLEPKMNFGRRAVALLLHLVFFGTLIYVAFLRETSTDRQTISPAELRKVVSEFREKKRVRMIRDAAEMRSKMAEMQSIRDKWMSDAAVDEGTEEVLEPQERGYRVLAAKPLENLKLHDVYGVAKSIEQNMVTLYREFLAARTMGLQQGFTYSEAYEASATPRPNRLGLDAKALYRDISTVKEGGGLSEFKAEIKKSTIEVREMSENCDKLLEFTRKSSTQTGDGISVDLSAEDVAMIGYRGPELLPDELDLTHEPDVGNFAAIPGRKLVTGGRTSEWMYVDSWYIIGPFPGDRRRENLDVRFGPEANVNLDDIFTGKDGQKIGWEYKKTGFVRQGPGQKTAHWKIEPKRVVAYAIYYAFTEIFSDVPREAWIATGTDDYGKLWINDELVWRSPKERKPYNATENIQLVNLAQGQNKILYRVENAGGTMGFSLLIRLAVEG
jgi:hypothetical protein